MSRPGHGEAHTSRWLAALEQFPSARDYVVPYYIGVSIIALHPEVTMVGSKPAVEDLGHNNAAFPEREGARRLLTAVAGVAFDCDVEPTFWHSGEAWRLAHVDVIATAILP